MDSDYDIDEYKLDDQLTDVEADQKKSEQLIKRKNVDLILKACSKLHFKSELSIYGEGYEKNKLIKIANT